MKNVGKRFRDFFIPSERNNFQPYSLRLPVAATVLGLVLIIEGVFLAHTLLILPQSNYFAAIFASVLINETNSSRQTQQLGTLATNPILEKAAQMKADDMSAKGYFAHNAPDGTTPWHWFDEAGYNYAAAGENLAVNFTDSKDVATAWMNSPTHRANIMNANYTEIGIATAHGTYKGKDAIFVVQEFGRPALVARETTPAEVLGNLPQQHPTSSKNLTVPSVSRKVIVSPPSNSIEKTVVPASLTPTSTVAGVATTKLSTDIAPINSPILETTHSNFFAELIASPRQTSNTLYLILAALLTLALGLAVFIKIRVQHAHIISNGVLLIAVLIALIILNSAIGFTQGIV